MISPGFGYAEGSSVHRRDTPAPILGELFGAQDRDTEHREPDDGSRLRDSQARASQARWIGGLLGLLAGVFIAEAAAAGAPAGPEVQVNTYTTGQQRIPSIGVDADGNFVVVWGSAGSSGSDNSLFSIQGQRYDASGTTVGTEFQVNTYTTNTQFLPEVALDSDGDFVVVWHSGGSAGSDTSGTSI